MKLQLSLLCFASILCLLQVVKNASLSEAVIECGKVHEIESQSLSSVNASFGNAKCALKCVIGNVALPVDLINEGKHCPEDIVGFCRAGQCIGGQEDSLRECELKHHLDFHREIVDPGTVFSNDQCMLRCVLGGVELSVNHKHEGSPCPSNLNGVCRSGTCVVQSTNTASTVTPSPTTNTPNPPTTVTQPSLDSFSPSKMKLLNILLESTDPPLNQNQVIYFSFRETPQSHQFDIFDVNGFSSTRNHHYLQNINDIPSMLKKDSQMMIQSYNVDIPIYSNQYEDLYPLFSTFYQNHKLAFGEQENFVHRFPIYRNDSRHDKLMDVALRFTIVFS